MGTGIEERPCQVANRLRIGDLNTYAGIHARTCISRHAQIAINAYMTASIDCYADSSWNCCAERQVPAAGETELQGV